MATNNNDTTIKEASSVPQNIEEQLSKLKEAVHCFDYVLEVMAQCHVFASEENITKIYKAIKYLRDLQTTQFALIQGLSIEKQRRQKEGIQSI